LPICSPQPGFGFAGTHDRIVCAVERGGEPYAVDDVLVALAPEQAALRRRQALKPSQQPAASFGQLQRAGLRGVQLAQLGARVCRALRFEGVNALAQLAQPRRAQRGDRGFGSQRGLFHRRPACVLERECELTVIRSAGGP
jgi:hypothetical protein